MAAGIALCAFVVAGCNDPSGPALSGSGNTDTAVLATTESMTDMPMTTDPTTTTAPPTTTTTTTTHHVVHTTTRTAPRTTKPASPLTCSASMSDPHPSHNQTTDVDVRTGVRGASVTATAHYKSKDTSHTVTAGSGGSAVVPFDIATATYNYTVRVSVTVKSGGTSRSCSTSFTPEQ